MTSPSPTASLQIAWIAVCVVPLCTMPAHGAGFLPNHGQVDEIVRFHASAPGATVYVTTDALVVNLVEVTPYVNDRSGPVHPVPTGSRNGCAVFIRFDGANASPDVVGYRPLPGRTNFYRGRSPQDWIAGLSTFEEVVYHDLWPGIDFACRLVGARLEYELRAAEGTDPASAGFLYAGMDRVIEESDDTSRLETPVGSLWNVRAGATRGAFVLAASPGGEARPAAEGEASLEWCTYLGGSELDSGNGVALDDASRPVVAGNTRSEDFPRTPGAYQESIGNPGVLQYDAFVAKLDASGSSLLWCTYLGGQGWDVAYGVVLDALGQPIVAGDTYSADFPTTPGCFDSTKAGTTPNADVFVTQLDSSGGNLVWSTFLGAGKDDNLVDIELDAGGNVVLGGFTESAGFPTTSGAFDEDKSFPFSSAGFVTKMNSTGTALPWSTVIEGTANDLVYGLALDPLGNVGICGSTTSSNFPVLAGSYDDTYNGGADAFAGILSADGSTLLAGTFLGSAGTDEAVSVGCTSTGEVIVAGHTDNEDFPAWTAGAYDETHNGGRDIFVSVLAADLGSLSWGTFFGGSGNDHWPSLLIDGCRCPVFGYITNSGDLPMGSEVPLDGSYNGTSSGADDAAIARLNADGDALVWNTYFGGTEGEHFRAHAFVLDSDGLTMVCTGWTGSADAPVTPGAYDETFNGAEDALVYRIVLPPAVGIPTPDPLSAFGAGILHSARPNPFTGSTEIRFDLPRTGAIRLSVHDAAGRLVRMLADDRREAGPHHLVWDGRSDDGTPVASGVYFCRLRIGDREECQRTVLLR